MMHGFNWMREGFCSYGFGGYFNIWSILLLLGVVAVVIAIVLMSTRKHKADASLDLLQRRFANGEITEEEYQKKKSVLEKG